MSQRYLEIFRENLINKEGIDRENVNKIVEKGYKVIERLDSLECSNKIGLMVGRVQSGKTVNFFSVIANAISFFDYKIIIVFTSIEKDLHKQTLDRLKNLFSTEEYSNVFSVFNTNDTDTRKNMRNQDSFICEIQDSLKDNNNKVIFFTVLKNATNINNLEKFFQKDERVFKNYKVLIIDDEGDDSSVSKDDKNNEKKTHKSLISLFNSFSNKVYLFVTATPYVHMMLKNDDEIIPKRVFVVEPGIGYQGNDFFDNDKYFITFNKQKEEILNSDIFEKSLLYYLLAWSLLIKEKKLDTFKEKSNFLIHIDVKNKNHATYYDSVRNRIKNWKSTLNDFSKTDMSYTSFIKKLKNIKDEYELKIPDDNFEDFIELNFKDVLNKCVTKEINQNNKLNIDGGLANILIGSKKLERGITMKNLIVTFFANRSKGLTAIDTLQQRARWFGYRNLILDYVKIFTTKQIKDDFKSIRYIENKLFSVLKECEADNEDFGLIDREIFTLENSKLKPTNRVPLEQRKSNDFCNSSSYINVLNDVKKYYSEIVDDLKKSHHELLLNNKYIYKYLSFKNIDGLLSKYPNLRFVLPTSFIQTNFSNKEIVVAFLDSIDKRGEPRLRGFYFDENEKLEYIKYIPQGPDETGNNYKGDRKWHEYNKEELNDKILIQLHYIQPYWEENEVKKLFGSPVYYHMIYLPEKFIGWTPKN